MHFLNLLCGHGLDHIHFVHTEERNRETHDHNWVWLWCWNTPLVEVLMGLMEHGTLDPSLDLIKVWSHLKYNLAPLFPGLCIGCGLKNNLDRSKWPVLSQWHWSGKNGTKVNIFWSLVKSKPWVTWSVSWDTPCRPSQIVPSGFWRQGGSTPWSWSGWAGSPCWRRGCQSSPWRRRGSHLASASLGC